MSSVEVVYGRTASLGIRQAFRCSCLATPAAKLNRHHGPIQYGSDPTQAASSIAQADDLIGGVRIPSAVAPSSSATGLAMTAWPASSTLDDYNNRLLTPVCIRIAEARYAY
ncbi:MAG: hypothetical protein FJW31_11705 [Acidobacteria bacterium]|nr:hypothetical protein [Acidobacteriota bacterium]